MLRDTQVSFGKVELSGESYVFVLLFIDKHIAGFRNYYLSDEKISSSENTITFHVINYFNDCFDEETEGYGPYRFTFVKNPPQPNSNRETDFGIVQKNKNQPQKTILEFEAKRLSDSSKNSEYVYGERGGIERFKKNLHGGHLNVCGMFGYMQCNDSAHWVGKINGWIDDKSKEKKDSTITWYDSERLESMESLDADVQKYQSKHSRNGKADIRLYHYFINLCR